MPSAKKGDFLKDLNPFSFGLPGSLILIGIIFIMSMMVTGRSSHGTLKLQGHISSLYYLVVNGTLTGILTIMMPALLTMLIIKASKRNVGLKYIAFVTGTSMFLLPLLPYSTYSLATTLTPMVLLVGDASMMVLASKILMQKKKVNLLFALIQPTLKLFISYGTKIISFSTPFNI